MVQPGMIGRRRSCCATAGRAGGNGVGSFAVSAATCGAAGVGAAAGAGATAACLLIEPVVSVSLSTRSVSLVTRVWLSLLVLSTLVFSAASSLVRRLIDF